MSKQTKHILRNWQWTGLMEGWRWSFEDSMARSLARALIEVPAKTQVLKGWWQGHLIQALVELLSKIQALKARWQSHPLHALVESNAKTKASKARWQGHPLQALIELKTKSHALPRFDRASASDFRDARRALCLACMEASPTPTCAGHTQASSEGRLISLPLPLKIELISFICTFFSGWWIFVAMLCTGHWSTLIPHYWAKPKGSRAKLLPKL